VFVIVPGQASPAFMALTANNSATVGTDTTLTGEITTAGGGLIRKICSYAHTASTSTYTEAVTFTANGSDTLPVTVAKAGMFPTLTGASGILGNPAVRNRHICGNWRPGHHHPDGNNLLTVCVRLWYDAGPAAVVRCAGSASAG
jgi:hypothetical protein